MADIICRWRNGTPKTVVELVNSLPHDKMSNEDFRIFMQHSQWGSEFFHTPYQLACQLGLYCEAEDGFYYPRFDHDISESEAQEYLEYWMPRYYVPNPYVGRNGFNGITCPTYVLFELYNYAIHHANCTYKEAYETIFQEKPTNNNDIVKNYINNYSKVLHFDANGCLIVTKEDPITIFNFMDRSSKKDFFDNFSRNNEHKNINFPLQQIFYGAPGTGKSHKVKEVTDTLPKSDVFRTTFHPDSDYSTFVGCYKPKMVKAPIRDSSGHEITSACEDEKKRIAYEYEPQAFLKAYVRAYETNEPVFLVIEEINRGNCAQIFGDMFQLLDRNENGESDYAIKPETAIQEFLNEKLKDCDIEDEAIKSSEEMRLPANLHIWATMNTSDQSLFPIDSAFKRRWDWRYIKIKDEKKSWTIEGGHDWWKFLEKINKVVLGMTSSADKQLGYFFCKANDANNEISKETFVNKVCFYLWNDVFKSFYSDEYADLFKIKKDGNDGELTFPDFFDDNGNVDSEIAEQFIGNVMKFGESQDKPTENQEAQA